MAVTTHRVITADTGASPNTSGAFTPAINDLLVVFVAATTTVETTPALTSSVGMTFTKVNKAVWNASADALYVYVSDALVSNAASQTVTWNDTGDVSSGTVISVTSVSGMTRVGLAAVKQSAITNNGAAAGTPATTFAASALTGNPTLGAVANSTNPATMTPPTNWTEFGDVGYATPTTGMEYVTRDSGFTGTVITWGGTSASVFAVASLELDTSASPTVTGAAIIQGLGRSDAAAFGRALAAAALSGLGRSDASAFAKAFGLAGLEGLGRSASAALAVALASAGLAGLGRSDSVGTRTAIAVAVLEGLGALGAAGLTVVSGAAALQGLGHSDTAGIRVALATVGLDALGRLDVVKVVLILNPCVPMGPPTTLVCAILDPSVGVSCPTLGAPTQGTCVILTPLGV